MAHDLEVVRVRAGGVSGREPDRVAVEAPLELRIGGKPFTVLMRTPGQDEDLVRGFLYTEGMIGSLTDVVSLERPPGLAGDERGNVVAVGLRPGQAPPVERLFYASSSCGVCGKASIAQLAIRAPRLEGDFKVSRAVLGRLPAALRAAQPIFEETGGLHASGLFTAAGELRAAREDVGRHNALDKLIGWALGAGEPLGQRVLAVSGRVGYEIIQKAIAAGLPVVAAVGAPTSLAVDLAEQFGVTLVGFLKAESMNIYAGAERVT
jgi:FdhD protein